MEHNLGARVAVSSGDLTAAQYDDLLSYSTDVEIFESGRQAAEHGLAAGPSPATIELRRKLDAKLRQRLAEAED